MNQSNRRALLFLALGVALVLALRFGVYDDAEPEVVAASAPTDAAAAELRLNRLRAIAAAVPAKQELAKQAAAGLAEREKGDINAETAPQAQAELLQIMRRLGKAEGIEIRGGEFTPARRLGDDYGLVGVAVTFDCRIEQLVNLLASLANEPVLIATESIRLNAGDPKQKTIGARIEISGVVPRKLVPERKGFL